MSRCSGVPTSSGPIAVRDADGGGLVAAARVERARDLALPVEDVPALLDAARDQHVAVDAEEVLAVEACLADLLQRADGLGFPGDRHGASHSNDWGYHRPRWKNGSTTTVSWSTSSSARSINLYRVTPLAVGETPGGRADRLRPPEADGDQGGHPLLRRRSGVPGALSDQGASDDRDRRRALRRHDGRRCADRGARACLREVAAALDVEGHATPTAARS